jgi:dipeptidyl aminopeptidase/acylaminoacyl peptidase
MKIRLQIFKPVFLSIAVGLALLSALPSIAESTGKPLTPEIAISRWSISDLRLSPDGTRLAMVVTEPIKGSDQRRNIWIYEIAGRQLIRFTASVKSDSRPRWSPDGSTLAFISNRGGSNQIYLIPARGGEALPLTEGQAGVNSFEWAPDGRRLVFELSPAKTADEEKKEKDRDDARVIERNEKNPGLHLIDVDSKAVRPLLQGPWRVSEYAWTPDGTGLIVSATDNPQKEIFSDKIFRLDAGDGRMTSLAAPAGPFGGLRISPDGKTLAFSGSRGDGPDPHDLFVMPVGGGPAVNLTARSLDRRVQAFEWEGSGRLFALTETGFGSTFMTVTTDGKAEKSALTPPCLVGSFARGRDVFAYVGGTSARVPELWLSTGAGPAEKASAFNKEWEGIALVEPEIVRYPSFDKREIEAALLKPAGVPPGKKLPLIVLVHGGPTGAWTNRIDTWGQLLVAKGYAVLYPNVRGSTGYGYDFMVANRYDWGGGDYKDVVAGVDWLIRKGVADPNRVAIGGWSYGGYMAAWAVTQTVRFKASVSGAPMTDLAMEYGTEYAGINASDTWFLGNPYENLPLFVERSPVTHVKKVKTPTLLLCGENDATDPIGQCYQFHRGLRRYGVDTEFVEYPREGHGIREEKHQIDMLNRIIAWFDKYLK